MENSNVFHEDYASLRIALYFLKISLWSGLLKTARVLYLLLHSFCCSMLFWLDHMKKIWLLADM